MLIRLLILFPGIMSETFRKSERLCSRKSISVLFEEGKNIRTSLFSLVWMKTSGTEPFPARAAFSVSKKNFRRAVDRNLIKRRMRESYRTEKQVLYECLNNLNTTIALFIIFNGKEIPDSRTINSEICRLLRKLTSEISENR